MWEFDVIRDHESAPGIERGETDLCMFSGVQPTRVAIIGNLPWLGDAILRRCDDSHKHYQVSVGGELVYPPELAVTL